MDIDDPVIVRLRDQVNAAFQEFTLAIQFHEAWKPAAYNEGLRERMGTSFATKGLVIIRAALRRETFSALLRLWDSSRYPDVITINMHAIKECLCKEEVQDALAKRLSRSRPALEAAMKADIQEKVRQIKAIVNQYLAGSEKHEVLESLMEMRHTRLAHRQVSPIENPKPDTDDLQVEEFFQDNLKLVKLLFRVVRWEVYNPEEFTDTIAMYVEQFWLGARGEQTDGHPNYKPRPRPA